MDMRLLGAVILGGVIVSGTVGGAFAYRLNYWFHHNSVQVDGEMLLEVAQGDTFADVTASLVERGLIADPFKFELIARLLRKTANLKIGEYNFVGNVTPVQVLQKIESGDAVRRRISFQEGRPVAHVWHQIEKATKVTNDIAGLSPAEVLKQLDLHIEADHLEGLFFPDTYGYLAYDSASSILQRAHDKLHAVLADAWDTRAEDLSIDNTYDLLILASIIEKESALSSDRKKISGVLHRRLAQGMLLQVDPTVIYGLGDSFDGDLKSNDLRNDHIYNTYVHKGLPPTPICMPSKDSILAASRPQAGEEMYFVGRGDGTSEFSKTLKEHNRAVRKYQMK